MPVSECTRFATRIADWNNVLSTVPTLPRAWQCVSAAFTCPSTWLSPTTTESRPEATEKCAPRLLRRSRRHTRLQIGMLTPAKSAKCGRDVVQGAVESRHRGIDLGPVAGRQDDHFVDVLTGKQGVHQLGRGRWVESKRARTSTGAVLCDTLRARMLIADSWVIGTRPVLVVGKDLEFLAKIDFAHVHTLRTPSTVGAKLRILVTPASTSRSATACAASAGVAMTAIAAAVLADVLQFTEIANRQPVNLLPTRPVPDRSGRRRGSRGSRSRNSWRVRCRVAQPDDDHRPVVGRSDCTADLQPEVADVVADPRLP